MKPCCVKGNSTKIMRTNKQLVFELQETQLPNYEECHDFLGFNKIEIIEFNYDGEGNALVFEDGEISYLCPDCLSHLFFSGWYLLVKPQ
jgi:hypothetical protein